MSRFSLWLRAQMDSRDLNISGLAAKLGLAHTSVRQWVTEESQPSPKSIRKLATVLGVDPIEIYVALDRVKPLPEDVPESKRVLIRRVLELPSTSDSVVARFLDALIELPAKPPDTNDDAGRG